MAKETKNIKEALKQLKNFQHVFLATIDDDQPRVRPVTLINFEGKFWITIDAKSEKVKQIMKNPKVEFSFIFKKRNRNCCLRVTGLAKIIKDRDRLKQNWRNIAIFSANIGKA